MKNKNTKFAFQQAGFSVSQVLLPVNGGLPNSVA
jgi:hypothetical protein